MPAWLIILLAIVAFAVIAAAVAVRRLTNTVGSVLTSLFSLGRGAVDITPDEPKSLNNMERIYLPQIKHDFPEYNAELMEARVRRDVARYYASARSSRVLFDGDDAVRSFRERLASELPSDVASDEIIHDVALSSYGQDLQGRVIGYQAAVEYVNTEGVTEQRKLTLKYIASYSDNVEEELRLTRCPSCGAAISAVGEKVCEYCGGAIDAASGRDWRIFDIA